MKNKSFCSLHGPSSSITQCTARSSVCSLILRRLASMTSPFRRLGEQEQAYFQYHSLQDQKRDD